MTEGWKIGNKARQGSSKERIDYIVNCKSDSLICPFSIVYSTPSPSKKNRGYYQVYCRLLGDSTKLSKIERVTYYLHPNTFKNNTIIVPGEDVMAIEIWGSFELRASVIYNNDGLLEEFTLNRKIIVTASNVVRTKPAIKPVYVVPDIVTQETPQIEFVPLIKSTSKILTYN